MRRRRPKKRQRRSQSEIFVSVVKALPRSSRKGGSIKSVADKSGTTWRTTKTHLDALRRAGLVETVKNKGMKRKKYKLKRVR